MHPAQVLLLFVRQRQILQHIAAQGTHERVGVKRQQPARLTRQHHRQRPHDRGEQQHSDAPVGEKHEKGQGNNDGEDAQHEVVLGAAAHTAPLK